MTDSDNGHRIVTRDVLASAIRRCVDGRGLDRSTCIAMADHILGFFGFSERIIDNVLDPEDRDMFYTLEDYELLVTERETLTLYDGREWRTHYWALNHDKIFDNNGTEKTDKSQEDGDYSVYDEIPEDVWAR